MGGTEVPCFGRFPNHLNGMTELRPLEFCPSKTFPELRTLLKSWALLIDRAMPR